MVSAIWNAASDGNLDAVKQLLQDHPSIDVEIKGQQQAYATKAQRECLIKPWIQTTQAQHLSSKLSDTATSM